MRFFADENVSRHTVETLRAAGHNVAWVIDVARSTDDESILESAQTADRIVLTFDKDFGDLTFRDRKESFAGVILLRMCNQQPEYVTRLVMQAIASQVDWAGHFAVIDDSSVRLSEIPPST